VPVSILGLAVITKHAGNVSQPLTDASLGTPVASLRIQFVGLDEDVPGILVLPTGVGDKPRALERGGLVVPVPGQECGGLQGLVEHAGLVGLAIRVQPVGKAPDEASGLRQAVS
jgi:hypothetical protein